MIAAAAAMRRDETWEPLSSSSRHVSSFTPSARFARVRVCERASERTTRSRNSIGGGVLRTRFLLDDVRYTFSSGYMKGHGTTRTCLRQILTTATTTTGKITAEDI